MRVSRVYSRSAHFASAVLFDVLLVRCVPPVAFAIVTYEAVGLRETSPAGTTTTATATSPTAAAAAAAGSSHPGNHPPAWPASPMPAVELSGQESYIWEMLQTDDRSYLPQGRALCLT